MNVGHALKSPVQMFQHTKGDLASLSTSYHIICNRQHFVSEMLWNGTSSSGIKASTQHTCSFYKDSFNLINHRQESLLTLQCPHVLQFLQKNCQICNGVLMSQWVSAEWKQMVTQPPTLRCFAFVVLLPNQAAGDSRYIEFILSYQIIVSGICHHELLILTALLCVVDFCGTLKLQE